jgi:hypothetical protein
MNKAAGLFTGPLLLAVLAVGFLFLLRFPPLKERLKETGGATVMSFVWVATMIAVALAEYHVISTALAHP